RLRPLTHTKNKTLLPIANKPMIFHMVERFMDIDINEIIFSIRDDDDEFKKVINEQNKIWKLKIHFQEEKPEDSKGMFYPIKLAEKLIGKDNFAFAAGDNILSW
ncbi:sugar phosphate nucleotidyltransferase, partial [Arthrospira platensis SPKY1]|nr:sugar phosphate nucleotidyltransferase [Arthrospira platensis SPKY1]